MFSTEFSSLVSVDVPAIYDQEFQILETINQRCCQLNYNVCLLFFF